MAQGIPGHWSVRNAVVVICARCLGTSVKRCPVSVRYQRYSKSCAYSYAFGISASIELLRWRPRWAREVLVLREDTGSTGVGQLVHLCEARGIPVRCCPHVIRRIAGREYPAVGVFTKYGLPIHSEANHLVLHQPRRTGNIGTTIRTMIGFGVTHLAVVGPGPEIASPEVVRASMGALFRLRWTRFETLAEYAGAFPEHRLYCFMTDGELCLEGLAPQPPFSLVFGSEGEGLPAIARRLGTTVQICHSRRIDSLNLGVAAGIALHEAMSGEPQTY